MGAYFGNAFSMLKASDPYGSKVGWFLASMNNVTMINDDDYRQSFAHNFAKMKEMREFLFLDVMTQDLQFILRNVCCCTWSLL